MTSWGCFFDTRRFSSTSLVWVAAILPEPGAAGEKHQRKFIANLLWVLQQKAESSGVPGAGKGLGSPDGSLWRALAFIFMCVFLLLCARAVVPGGLVNHTGGIHLSQEGRRCGGSLWHSSVQVSSHGPSLMSPSQWVVTPTLRARPVLPLSDFLAAQRGGGYQQWLFDVFNWPAVSYVIFLYKETHERELPAWLMHLSFTWAA